MGAECDYSLKLTWGGRPYKNGERRKRANMSATPVVPRSYTPEFTHTPMVRDASIKKEPTENIGVKPEPDMYPVTLADIDQGIQSTLQTLDRFSNGNNLFSLRNLEIFNSYISSQSVDTPHSPLFMDLVDNYASDIARIENSFPEEPKSPYFSAFPSPPWKKTTEEESVVLTPTPAHTDPLNHYDGAVMSVHHEERRALEALVQIPPLLMPLPEILLKVPYYRLLLHFWVNVALDNLVPAPSHLYQDNPFKVLLPRMAMHYPGVLTTILAYAARARDTLDGVQANHQEIIDHLLSRLCLELLRQLQDKRESTLDGTLATILLLSCYEVVNSNDFEKHRTHTTGASQIISARNRADVSPKLDGDSDDSSTTSLSLSRVRDESDIAFFLMRWFVYVDVLGALSSIRGRENYLRGYRKSRYDPIISVPTLESDPANTDPKRDIDYLLGFDVRLLPHFINLALLIREVERYTTDAESDATCIPLYIVTEALELKERFTKAYEVGEERRQATIDKLIDSKKRTSPRSHKNIKDIIQHDNILRGTNRMFFDMGMLNLYRRVLLLPRLSPVIQDLASGVAEILDLGIESGSTAEVCTIFCHFCAGCETLDPEKRSFFYDRFSRLAHMGNNNATKSLVIMNRCWETGEDWITAANALDIDLVLM